MKTRFNEESGATRPEHPEKFDEGSAIFRQIDRIDADSRPDSILDLQSFPGHRTGSSGLTAWLAGKSVWNGACMGIERRVSLGQAARLSGINRTTLRRWLESDLGFVFPNRARGSKVLLRESEIEAVLSAHSPKVDPRLLRRKRAA